MEDNTYLEKVREVSFRELLGTRHSYDSLPVGFQRPAVLWFDTSLDFLKCVHVKGFGLSNEMPKTPTEYLVLVDSVVWVGMLVTLGK